MDHPASAPLSPGRVRLFKLVLVSLPLLLLAGLEGCLALRFRRDYPGSSLAVQGAWRMTPSPYRSYQNNPGYVRRHDDVVYRYDKYGFREEEDLGEKQPGELRVFWLGGSAAYGERASELGQYQLISGQTTYPSSKTIAAYLQAELQKQLPGRKVRVVNAAVVSYRIHHDFLTYLELLRDLKPDLVVTMDGQNELFKAANPFSAGNALKPYDLAGGPLAELARKHSYLAFYGAGFLRESDLFASLRGYRREEVSRAELAAMDADTIREENRKAGAAYVADQAALDGLLKVYELFHTATRLDDVPALFLLQPVLTLDVSKPLTSKEKDLLKYLRRVDYQKYGMLALDRRLRGRAQQGDSFHYASLLDVFGDFPGEAYTDYCHLTPAANEHVARHLATLIQQTPDLLRSDSK